MEWAQYGGKQGYPRYAIGVVAPLIAWPTVFLPYDYALITQFLGFTYLYYADATAAARGWTPAWYGTYRFVLTFIVGASIVLSLIGRGEIGDVMERQQMGIQTVANPGKALKVEGEKKGAAARNEYESKKAKVMDQLEESKRKEREAKAEDDKKKKTSKKDKKDDGDESGESEGDEDENKDANEESNEDGEDSANDQEDDDAEKSDGDEQQTEDSKKK